MILLDFTSIKLNKLVLLLNAFNFGLVYLDLMNEIMKKSLVLVMFEADFCYWEAVGYLS